MSEKYGRFARQRVLVTSADIYMGPAIVDRFTGEDADVTADVGRYSAPDEPAAIIAEAGHIDILVLNLLPENFIRQLATDTDETEWLRMFELLVHPTMRFVKAVLPQMIERRSGKIVAVTSAAPLRAIEAVSSYTAARGAQNAYVRAVGAEIAPFNIQFNAIGQNYVYGGYPANAMDDPVIREKVMRDVPARRFAEGWEQAELVLFLASQNSNFISGQVVPFSGGWVT
ncbi:MULTISPECIES: SDR family NAD(P)-dependent oxidoreductase [Sphingobium]|uniref:SDR family NAD(P)-dependent oxidoreductase n=1 Tax=Sphingobium sp. MI1205 TaxID=407020 RepID=UPI0007703420|nr:SDR family oxidoreductase [Sphingobium sp. MI1205]AMK19968.1 Short-chain dehydrogenase/reductase SDR [Sphingobium sp. MI1205]